MPTNTSPLEERSTICRILDRLEAIGAEATVSQRAMAEPHVRRWVRQGYTLDCVNGAIARGMAKRAAAGCKLPLNHRLIEAIMRAARPPSYRQVGTQLRGA